MSFQSFRRFIVFILHSKFILTIQKLCCGFSLRLPHQNYPTPERSPCNQKKAESVTLDLNFFARHNKTKILNPFLRSAQNPKNNNNASYPLLALPAPHRTQHDSNTHTASGKCVGSTSFHRTNTFFVAHIRTFSSALSTTVFHRKRFRVCGTGSGSRIFKFTK